MLAASIRAFGGSLSDNPIWALTPGPADKISIQTRERLARLRVELASFGIEPDVRKLPFGAKTCGAGAAEDLVRGQAALLAWMDVDSIVVQQPTQLIIGSGADLGYRPVDHTLIASPHASPPDAFWSAIYRACDVPPERLFAMTTTVDRQEIRPYFNAGLLVVRPTARLLRSWGDNLRRLLASPEFTPFLEEADVYRVFFHQAVLAGTILASVDPQRVQELSRLVSYPLHMHEQYPAVHRPRSLNEVITCRYDTLFESEEWRGAFVVHEPLESWLGEYLAQPATSGQSP
jgi:hypothetical protein